MADDTQDGPSSREKERAASLARDIARLKKEKDDRDTAQKGELATLKELNDERQREASLLERKLEAEKSEFENKSRLLAQKKENLNALKLEHLAHEELALSAAATEEEKWTSAAAAVHLAGEIEKLNIAIRGESSELEKNEKALEKTAKATNEATESSKNMQKTIGSLTTTVVGFRGGLGKTVTSLNKMKGVAHGIGTSLMSAFSAAGIVDMFAAFGNVMIQAVLDIDNQRLALVQATGAAEGLQDAMYGLRAETMGLAVTGADLAQGLITLREGMRDFDDLTTKSKVTMSVMATQLDKLGLAFQDQTRIMQFMNVTMGQTMGQAQKTVKELYNMTAAAGKGPKELAADFQAAAPMLSVYGKKMRHEFSQMASISRETGIEMSKLLGIAGTMDTFEGAADLAGTMNAFLGGPYLNTVELVSMTEQERLIAIKRSMDASGRSFKQMSRYQQKGIAKSLNMDLAEANALFSSSEKAIRGRSREMEKAAKREANYKKKIQESLPFMQALQMAFREVGMAIAASFLGLGKNASPEEMVKALHNKLDDFKSFMVDYLIPGIKKVTWVLGLLFGVQIISSAVKFFGVMSSGWLKVAESATASMTAQKGAALAGKAGKLLGAAGAIGGVAKAVTSESIGGKISGALSAIGGGLMFLPGIGTALGAGLMGAGAIGSMMFDDFIYRGDGSAKGATIQPINKNDSFVGVKPGGGMDHNMSAMLAELRSLNRAQAEQSRALRDLAEKTGKMQINMDGKKVGEAVSGTVIKTINDNSRRVIGRG